MWQAKALAFVQTQADYEVVCFPLSSASKTPQITAISNLSFIANSYTATNKQIAHRRYTQVCIFL